MIEPVARLKIQLSDIRPPIWRRVDVPLSTTLLRLHDILQVLFGWTDSHLFEFTVAGRAYGVPYEESELSGYTCYRANRLRLGTVVERGVGEFQYLYDFGDAWRHDVLIERVGDGSAGTEYPEFVGGERRAPPEDVGGPEGFMTFMEAALIPTHEDHAEWLAWYGGPFDHADIGERWIRLLFKSMARRRRGALSRHRRVPPRRDR